jgi:hypothetical protein
MDEFLAGPDTVHPRVGDHLSRRHGHPVHVVFAPVSAKQEQPIRGRLVERTTN